MISTRSCPGNRARSNALIPNAASVGATAPSVVEIPLCSIVQSNLVKIGSCANRSPRVWRRSQRLAQQMKVL